MSRLVRRGLAPLVLLALVLSALPTLLVASPARAATACSNADMPASPAQIAAVRAAVLCLINEERARVGLGALSPSTKLDAASALHNAWMANTQVLSHEECGPGGRPGLEDRAVAAGYGWQAVRENLASGQTTPQDVFDDWMTSTSHKANIQANDVVDFGLDLNGGTVDGGLTPIWTTMFGTPGTGGGSNGRVDCGAGNLPPGSTTGKKSKLKVKAVGAKSRATLTITAKAGKKPAKGKLLILRDGALVKKAKVKKGKAKGRVTVTLKGQPRGKHLYTVVYLGNAKTKASQKQVKVKVR